MSHEAQVIISFLIGVVGTLFCQYLTWRWEAKKERKKRQYPKAWISKK